MTRNEKIKAIFLYPLIVPHFIVYLFLSTEIKNTIRKDISEMNRLKKYKEGLFYYLAFHQPYRNLFYYRVGHIISFFLKYLRPYPLFFIQTKQLGNYPYVLNHPYGTILHAKSIGEHFVFCHLTTIGNGKHGDNDSIPTIGNNVSCGANVTILGRINIGNNVTIGAGSVVIKDLPDNCVAAGNPCKVIKFKE